MQLGSGRLCFSPVLQRKTDSTKRFGNAASGMLIAVVQVLPAESDSGHKPSRWPRAPKSNDREEAVNDRRRIQAVSGKMSRLLAIAILVVMVIPLAQPAMAAQGNPRVAPPGSSPYGKAYGEWNAEWWKWAMTFPASASPLTDDTGANCGAGQSGPVFFLVGTTSSDPVVRDDCVVPAGKALFFPMINVICAVPEDGSTFEEIRSLCSWYEDHVDAVQATVDGTSLQNLLSGYRFPSPDFSFTGAVDNPFDTGCGTPGTCYEGFRETAFSDGYWVMLPPLPPGAHTIHFGGHLSIPEWGSEFSQDVTYHLTVANPGP